jgi:tetratricopeptide (TPR) repeat protein
MCQNDTGAHFPLMAVTGEVLDTAFLSGYCGAAELPGTRPVRGKTTGKVCGPTHRSYFREVIMSLLRIAVCLFCLFAAGVSAVTAGDKDYKELYRRGVEHNKKGELDEAITLYSKAIALKPDAAVLFFVRGRAYLEKQQFNSAIGDLGKAIALRPRYAEAYNIRGIAYASNGQKQLATADFRKACTMGLNDACKNIK